MDKIELIPVEQLMHHPDNPRKDLGDLTELAESIRANGILQNLTVVPVVRDMTDDEWQEAARLYHDHPTEELRTRMNARKYVDPDHYWVVIGNRRFEAAQIAGMTELPCVVSDMDQKTQVATMLQENMQRSDLTIYEQAQGFQMMMDLGFSEDQIAENTGFSKTTVRRRIKMAELNPKELKRVCDEDGVNRQITLADFDKLAKIDDVKKRNELLGHIGTGNFNWEYGRAYREQETSKVLPEVKQLIRRAKITKLPDGKRWSGEYDRKSEWSVKLDQWKSGDKLIPEVEGEIFYLIDGSDLEFYLKHKRADPVRKTEEEKARERQIAEAWEKVKQDTEMARQLRREYADSKITMNLKKLPDMMKHLIIASVICDIDYCSTSESLRELLNINDVTYDQRVSKAIEKLNTMPINIWPRVIRSFYDADNKTGYYEGWQREMPRWKANQHLDCYYDWLIENGYQMSEVEKQLQNGTYPYFEKKPAESDYEDEEEDDG